MAASEPPRGLRGPFLMPDGRPLSALLEQQEHVRPPRGGSSGPKRRPGAVKEPKEGWSKPLPRAAAAASGAGGAPSEAEQAELYALSRVGQRKQRRWLNDKLLRDMAGALTASDMASLFKPVPFGEQRTSLWERAAQPEHAVLWELFRSLDMDKQTRVLQKWEAHVRELQAGPGAIRNPAVDAIAAWAGVSWRARQAMKRCSPSHVQAIEAQVLAFLQQEGQDELVVQGLDDGFHRLIAHGLAEYHTLASHSRPLPGGGKEVVMRRRQAASSSAAAAAAAALVAAADDDEEAGEEAAAAGHQHRQPHSAAAAAAKLPISCCDILHILLDESQPLSSAVLSAAYLHTGDSSSEAGDLHPYGHHQVHHPHHHPSMETVLEEPEAQHFGHQHEHQHEHHQHQHDHHQHQQHHRQHGQHQQQPQHGQHQQHHQHAVPAS